MDTWPWAWRGLGITLYCLCLVSLFGCNDVSSVSQPKPASQGAPSITTASLKIGVVGQPYQDTLAGTGGTPPYTWSVLPALPSSLQLNSATGIINGTPTGTTNADFTFTMQDSSSPMNIVKKSLTVTIVPQPPVLTILTTTLPPGTVNQPYAQTLQAAGGTSPLTWTLVAGSLPQNFSLNSAGDISGTASTPTTSNFTVQVTDAAGQADTQVLSLAVNLPPPPSITTTSLPGGTVGTPYSQSVQASVGTGALSWSVSSGSLPAGLTMNAATGVISGTPAAPGTFNFSVEVIDTVGQSDTRALSITIAAVPVPPVIATTSLPGGTVATSYSQPLQATGGTGALTWSISAGALPSGLSINSSLGMIAGTPNTAGTFNFTVRVADSLGLAATQPLSITIVNPPPPTITTTSLPGGTAGTPYSQTIQASGGTGSRIWSVISGALPTNLSLNPTTGVIAGTPASGGTFNFTVQVTDSLSLLDTQPLSITIAGAAPPSITTTSLPAGTVGTSYNETLQATGGSGALVWSVSSGSLPNNLTLSSAGKITGSPTNAGTSNFTIKVTDTLSQSATRGFSITVNPKDKGKGNQD